MNFKIMEWFKQEQKIQEQKFFILEKFGEKIKVQVRHSKKAKRIAIRINIYNKTAELVLPNKELDKGYKFLLEKERWVRQKLRAHVAQTSIDNSSLPIFGKEHKLRYIDCSYNNKVQIENDVIHIHSLPRSSSLKKEEVLSKFLKDKLLVQATRLSAHLCTKYNLKFAKIKITNSKSKWGSCSSKGVLMFNWRLIFAPQEILEYVVVHEMCHTIEMNHSKNFWNLVSNIYPDYKKAKLWLKTNGSRLYQYLQA